MTHRFLYVHIYYKGESDKLNIVHCTMMDMSINLERKIYFSEAFFFNELFRDILLHDILNVSCIGKPKRYR